MAGVKISPPPPIGLPTGSALTGAELVPMDQTTGGITTTIKASASSIAALGVTSGTILGTANQIAVSVAAGVATISFSPNIVIPVPGGGGTPLTVSGAPGAYTTQINGSASIGNSYGLLVFAGTSAIDTAMLVLNEVGSTVFLRLLGDFSGQIGPVSWAAAGNVTIAAPGSGTSLEIDRTGDGTSIAFVRSGVLSGQVGFGAAFVAGQFEVFSQGTVPMGAGTAGAQSLNLYTNSVNRISVNSAGNVIIAAPSSGTALTVRSNSALVPAIIADNSTAGGDAFTVSCSANSTGLRAWTHRVGSTGSYVIGTAADSGADINNVLILARDASGNFLGATITAPSSGTALTVGTSTSGTQNATIGLTNFGVGVTFLANQAEIFSTSTTSLNIGAAGAAALNFYTSAANRFSINASGNSNFSTTLSLANKPVLYSNDATANTVGGKVSSQSGGTASGGNPGDIILIY